MLPGLNATAVGWSRQHPTWTPGHCLEHCRTAAGLNARYGSAILAWKNARDRHPGDLTPPVGALFFFRGGRYGHVALGTDGRGGIRSTDWPARGMVGETTVDELAKAWGYEPLGWAENVNDQPAWRRPVVDVSGVQAALRHSGSVRHGEWVKRALAHAVGRGRMRVADDHLGFRARRRFRKWQRRLGTTVTGIPTARDLALLGDADHDHLFNVQP